MKSILIILLILILPLFNIFCIKLSGTCWKGYTYDSVDYVFSYMLFEDDSSYVYYNLQNEIRALGFYNIQNDSILIKQIKGENDEYFPENSKYRLGSKKYWLYYRDNELVKNYPVDSSNLLYLNNPRYDDYRFSLIQDYEYGNVINNNPFFYNIPSDTFLEEWISTNGNITLLFDSDIVYSYKLFSNGLSYSSNLYANGDTLLFSKSIRKFENKVFNQYLQDFYFLNFNSNILMKLLFQDEKLIGVSEGAQDLIFIKKIE